MRKKITMRNKESWLFLAAITAFLAGAGFALAYNSGQPPPIFGHDVEEMNWSTAIPNINANQACIGGNCRTSWPSLVNTKCNVPGRCGQVCIGSICRTTWPSSAPTPPVCSGNEILENVLGGWACVPVNVAGPTRYRCPSYNSNCAFSPECNGQIQTGPAYCYGQRYTGPGFCTGCGCYASVMHGCMPLYD